MIEIEVKHPKKLFNDQILAILNKYETPLEVFYGGASSGKSHGVYQKYAWKAMKGWKKPRKVLILRKIGASIRDSSWEHMQDVLAQFKILPYCEVNKSDFRITLPNKAMFLFKGLDDPEKIKSIKGVSDIILEEATEFTLEDFTQLKLRLRDKEHKFRQMALMFNPIHKLNWVYNFFFWDRENNRPREFKEHGGIIYHSTYKDNRFLDEASKQDIEDLRFRNPAYYRIYALGEFATLDKLVFPVVEYRIISEKEVSHLEQLNGLDFGYINDPSALSNVRYDKEEKTIFITGEYVKEHLLNNKIAEAIINLGLSKERIFADSQEEKSIDEIQLYGIPRIEAVKKGPHSVIQGIQWMQQHKIVVDERCFKTREEFENYTWKKDKKTGEYTNDPVDTYNHTIDAIRYALSEKINGEGEIQILNRRKLGF